MDPKTVSEQIADLQAHGHYSFTTNELKRAVGESNAAVKLSLWRLARKRRIVPIREGFYIVVPLEYASTGVLPPEWFIAELMKFIGQPYYVGLLSAAAVHGASHQQPQEFQVVVPKPVRSIHARNLTIRFFTKTAMQSSPVEEVKTSTGYMRVSNPAVTAIDLVAYASRVGGLDGVLTVLQDLSETIRPDMLLDAAKKEEQLASVQRLGWLLEKEGHRELVDQLATWIRSRKVRETPLDPSQPKKGFSRDFRWKVIANAELSSPLRSI